MEFKHRDRGTTLRLGAPIVTQYWGGTRHFFLLILYNFKNIGGGGGCALSLIMTVPEVPFGSSIDY